MRQRGFTLLEMVVTVLIFGIVGVIAIQLLSQSTRISEKVIHRSQVVGEWHRGLIVMELDFAQLVHRAVRDEFGDEFPSLVLLNEETIEFTRHGWQNPLGLQRSDLQRVSYFVANNSIYRRFWSVLDRSKDTQPVDQLLIRDVSYIRFEIWDSLGNLHTYWPRAETELETTEITDAVMVSMFVASNAFGEVVRHWIIPATVLPQPTPVS